MTEQRPPRVFISYSHDTVAHQERVLGFADRLRADGIDAEIDQYNAAPPEGWPLWCERQIAAADVVLMVCTETYHRRVKGDEEQGKGLGVVWEARIIRQLLYDAGGVSNKFVPLLFSDASPEQIPRPIKGWTHYVLDTEDGYEDLYRRLTGQPRLTRPALGTIRALPTRQRHWLEGTMAAASSSPARVSPTERGRLERVGGAVPWDSKFYVERKSDAEFLRAVFRRATTVLVWGARQTGKTSLLARGMETARKAGMQVVLTDLQKLSARQLQSHESFFLALGELIADQLDLDVFPQDTWKQGRSPNSNFQRYLKQEILAKVPGQLLWALDEADRLFSCDFGQDVFALFRTWHNAAALYDSVWSRLTLAIVYATEGHLLIRDSDQSPFNVATQLALEDFTLEQVADLNRRYGSPLREGPELRRFYQLVGGQPYIVRRSLNDIVDHDMTIEEFERHYRRT